MSSSNLNAILVTASELAMEGRWREAIEIATRVISLSPSTHEAWWILGQGYDSLGRGDDAAQAYAEYYRHAPKTEELRAMRSFAAEVAGVPFEEAEDAEAGSGKPLVSFIVNIGGKNVLVQARNDTGKTPEEVIESAEKFVSSVNTFEAWVHASRSPELFTSLGDTVLSALAQAQSDPSDRAGIEQYRDALRRVREGEGVAPFAELTQLSVEDFSAFVTAADDLQPNLQRLAEAADDEQRVAVLSEHPELLSDDRTLTYLRILGGLQRSSEGRDLIQFLFTFIRRMRRGQGAIKGRTPTDRERQAERQSRFAVENGDLAAIDAALAEWTSIEASKQFGDALLAAVTRGALLLARYDITNDPVDLEMSCSILRRAMDEQGDDDSPALPYQYGVSLLRWYEHDGNPEVLDNAITCMHQALELVVDGVATEGAARSMLGAMLLQRAEHTGNVSDLNESITHQRLAVTAEATPNQLAVRLANLGTACVNRFRASGEVADLDEAERSFEEALAEAPSFQEAQTGLARVFRSRYQITDDPEWIDRAIEKYRTFINANQGPLDIALVRNNLSAALRDRYLAQGDPSDIDEAIELSRQAVTAAPAGFAQKPLWLENLANSLRVRAIGTDSAEDRRDAVAAFKEAIAIAPEGSAIWRTSIADLGSLLNEAGDQKSAVDLLELGFNRSVEQGADVDLIAISRALALAHARQGNWDRAGEALMVGSAALDRVQRAQISTDAKKAWLSKAGDLHIFAADALFRVGRPGDAVMAIERGRGRLLSEVLSRDRAALAELDRMGDQRLVASYRTAAEQVRMLSAAADRGQDVLQALLRARKTLADVANEVRDRSGGVAFTEPPDMEDVVAASVRAKAPLVYLAPLAGYGIGIIVSDGPLKTVLLPALSAESVESAVEKYVKAYAEFVAATKPNARQEWQSTLDETLRWLWESCMREVVGALKPTSEAILVPVGQLGRLPLHAACGAEGSALDEMMLRYAPSARSLTQLGVTNPDSILTVAFANERAPLPYTALETAAARTAFEISVALEGDSASAPKVIEKARDATVLHFACHATAAGYDAHAGGLELSDGALSLQQLFDMRLASGAIAVLSACETGVIGERLPDEVLSIASGMLQSGASAVISSLWAVPDVSTAILMSHFYFLWREEGHSTADALRASQRWLRDSNNGTIATFLRAHYQADIVQKLAELLEINREEVMFAPCAHWAAFTYSGI